MFDILRSNCAELLMSLLCLKDYAIMDNLIVLMLYVKSVCLKPEFKRGRICVLVYFYVKVQLTYNTSGVLSKSPRYRTC